MKKGLLLLTFILIANTSFAKIDIRSESQNITSVIRDSIANETGWDSYKKHKLITNFEMLKNFEHKDASENRFPDYFSHIIDAYIVSAQMGDSSLACLRNPTPQIRRDIAQVYKEAINEGIIKMNDSAAIGIYQTIRLVCDLRSTGVQKQYEETIKNNLSEKYL